MKHCLVVDDSAVIRKVARRILEELRFSATEAENGREALDQCRESMPDVGRVPAANFARCPFPATRQRILKSCDSSWESVYQRKSWQPHAW